MATRKNIMSLSEASKIASYSLQQPGHPEVELAQAEHRIRLVNLWDIAPGSRVLELGCGQGNATAVLAHAVGPQGHVDAVDPGALDYGAPFTLAQSQDYLSHSAVGDRIAWHQATPEQFLEQTDEGGKWDVAVLAHCTWYFDSPLVLLSIFLALQDRVKRLCIAEYAMHATEKAAVPHVLAVLARSTLESFKEESSENVRSPFSPSAIKGIAGEATWKVIGDEHTLVPEPGLLDGSWEVGTVKSKGFAEEIRQSIDSLRVRLVVDTARDAVLTAVDNLKGEKVRTMDVWTATFEENCEIDV
ncbi:putative S-adenosyl-L-methionine-dependent methyltransferase [Seiridium cardinale]|uniref:S-adenosyl-L-methionine-dependent methyltransferase n=1 Tax=Seiridium cardinale TaxID=138064 RepID=A0ABR2XQN9_9PEZI